MMEELDLLKKDWKRSENSYQQISEVDLYKMLHKKSSSIVKWILIISIVEFVILRGLDFLILCDDEFIKKMERIHLYNFEIILTSINYIVLIAFIYLFYKNFKSINTASSTKKLMFDILNTRKVVKYYVWYNLGIIVVSVIIGFILAFSMNPKIQEITSNNKVFIFTILFCTVALVLFVGLFWLFYRLLYGILLRKLFRNYNELKKIDL